MRVWDVFIGVSVARAYFIGPVNSTNREIYLLTTGVQFVNAYVLVKRNWLLTSTKNDRIDLATNWTEYD